MVAELSSSGLKVSTIKHAHHIFDLDQSGTDSYKHRESGALEVAIVSRKRWAIQHELNDQQEPSLKEMVAKLSPCDIVLVEGYKREDIPKIEIMADETDPKDYLWPNDSSVLAIACDHDIDGCNLPRFGRSDVSAIAEFIRNGLKK